MSTDKAQASLFDCDHLAVISVTGDDAETFLQGQLTSDLLNMQTGDFRLAMHLNVKGRASTSLQIIRQSDGFALIVPTEMTETVLSGLQKYALFSKVNLTPQAEIRVFGTTDEALAQQYNGAVMTLPGEKRWLLLADDALTETLTASASGDGNGNGNDWLALDIQAGLAHVFKAGSEHWLPQELNYDLIDGIHFNKGCYLGQEVAARLHFKGKAKQRLRCLTWLATDKPAIGATLENEDGKKIGDITAATINDDNILALAVVRIDYQGEIFMDGHALQASALALPYEQELEQENEN